MSSTASNRSSANYAIGRLRRDKEDHLALVGDIHRIEAEQLARALTMPRDERHMRMRHLRASVREEDIAWCSQVSVLDVVPRLSRMLEDVAEVTGG